MHMHTRMRNACCYMHSAYTYTLRMDTVPCFLCFQLSLSSGTLQTGLSHRSPPVISIPVDRMPQGVTMMASLTTAMDWTTQPIGQPNRPAVTKNTCNKHAKCAESHANCCLHKCTAMPHVCTYPSKYLSMYVSMHTVHWWLWLFNVQKLYW